MLFSLKNLVYHILRNYPWTLGSQRRLLMTTLDRKNLDKSIKRALKNVPFYKDYMISLDESGHIDLQQFPIIRKKELVGKEPLLVSKKYCKKLLKRAKTGGTSGVSLKLYQSIFTILRKNVVANKGLREIGGVKKMAILRGYRPKKGKIYEQLLSGDIIMSSYRLLPQYVDEYLNILRSNNIECIQAYPSSIIILARMIKQKYGLAKLPKLKGIFVSSESFTDIDRNFVSSVFPNVKIVNYYGQNELVCCALRIGDEPFVFYPNFGYVEFVPTGEQTSEGNEICEIVATSILNKAMSLIRYGTEDYVSIDKDGKVTNILGRQSDFAVNKLGQILPCTLLTREVSMKNVTNFQFYQPEIGKMVFRVVVNKLFGDADKKLLEEDLKGSFGEDMECVVDVRDNIERTKAGKQRRLIQDFIVHDYL